MYYLLNRNDSYNKEWWKRSDTYSKERVDKKKQMESAPIVGEIGTSFGSFVGLIILI